MADDLPSLNALRAFEAAARLESVTRAGEALHVTHGAVSRQIRMLEEALGVALFVRESRGVRLTEAGRRLRDATADAFGRLASACAEVRRESSTAPFVLGCSGSLLARWFIPRLGQLRQDLPALNLHLSASEGDDPLSQGLDAALAFVEAPLPAGLEVHPLAPERIGPVVGVNYPGLAALRGAPVTALSDALLLHTESRPQAWPNWCESVGLDPRSLPAGQGFPHLYYLLEAAVAGLGVAIAPEPLVAEDLKAGRLLAPWGFRQTSGHLALLAPRRGTSDKVAQLVAWMRGMLA